MSKFLAMIHVTGIDPNKMEPLPETKVQVMEQYKAAGNLLASFVRKNHLGAFLVFSTDDLAHFEVLLQGLPMFPYMTVEAVELI